MSAATKKFSLRNFAFFLISASYLLLNLLSPGTALSAIASPSAYYKLNLVNNPGGY